MTASDQLPAQYRICIRGHLDPDWATWFDDLAIVPASDGTTTLSVRLADQSALFGLLARLRDFGATLLMVERLPAGESPLSHRSRPVEPDPP